MANSKDLTTILKAYQHIFHPVISFDKKKDKILLMDFTEKNIELNENIFNHTSSFAHYINQRLQSANARYGIGGYAESRAFYSRSKVFDPVGKSEEPRRLHLGIDIWGKLGTPVFAPFGGTVHSFKFNDAFGDYGATIILQHQLDTVLFYTLYGHLSHADLGSLRTGQFISVGETFAHFGGEKENGHWPPHLHFQIIADMENMKGDYPGVCTLSDAKKYLANCPDADIILQLMQYAVGN